MLKRNVLCLGFLLSTALLLTACGKDESEARPLPKASEQIRSTVSALAPVDSAVLIRFASASKVNEMTRSMAEFFRSLETDTTPR